MSPILNALKKTVQTLVTVAEVVSRFAFNVKKRVKTKVTRDFFTPITFIKVKDLLTDEEYQRLINEKFIENANGFDPDLARPLVVAKRPKKLGGEYVVVDGQHTACLAEVYLEGDGEQEIPCQIPKVLRHPNDRTIEECIIVEAEFFEKLNYLRNNPSAIARLRAGVARKDRKSLEWEATFQSIGIHVEKVGDPDGHSVFGLAKLKTCINKYGSTYTKQAVETYANTIKYSTSEAWNNPLQGGLILGLTAAYHFVDNYAGDGATKDGFLEFLGNNLTLKTPKEWTEKTSGVIMDILIVEDKLVDSYNSAVGFGVIKAPKIGNKRVTDWKADPIHAKGSKDNNDD
tara:strand:+ start:90 stop:1121 length:1032 start_codon:yes stop_codon:yes gene_type:complete